MKVTANIVGDAEVEVTLPADATYADLCRELDYSPHEVSVLVDGSPEPNDQVVDATEVSVIQLIKGG